MPKDGRKPGQRKPVNYSRWNKNFPLSPEIVYERAHDVCASLMNDEIVADGGRVYAKGDDGFRPLDLFVGPDTDRSLLDAGTVLKRMQLALDIVQAQGTFLLAHTLIFEGLLELPPGVDPDIALQPLCDEGGYASCVEQMQLLRKRQPTAKELDPNGDRNRPLAVVDTPTGQKLAVTGGHLASLVETPGSEGNRYFLRQVRDGLFGPMVHLGFFEAHERPGHAPRYSPHLTLDAFAEEIWEPMATEISRWYGGLLGDL